jgi:hypothetical protein
MVVAALVFFSPSWPRRLPFVARWAGQPPASAPVVRRLPTPALLVGLCYVALQVLMPLRTHLYGGNVLWHEQGMRWSWRVMVREKNGSVSYTVRDRATGREWLALPRDYLQDYQEHEMATQPDLILQLGQVIAADFRRRLGREVEVRAEALVSLNGRPAAALVAPEVDLARLRDGVAPQPWIARPPKGAPAHLHRLTSR